MPSTLRWAVALVEGDEDVRRAEVAVVLRDLVLEDQVVTPRVPRELGHQAMVLVPVVAVVGEDQVGIHVGLELLEVVLDLGTHPGEVALPEALDADVLLARAGQEVLGGVLRLGCPDVVRAEHDPVETSGRELLGETQDGAAATDLDVVAVSPEAQDVERVILGLDQRQREHQVVPVRQSSQGGLPWE